MGVNSENPPWIFMKDDKMTGFEADLIEEFAKRAGTTIEYKSAPFATVLTGVQSGQWDVAMSSIWVKKERMEVMDFADPYYDAQIGMMVKMPGGITKFADEGQGLRVRHRFRQRTLAQGSPGQVRPVRNEELRLLVGRRAGPAGGPPGRGGGGCADRAVLHPAAPGSQPGHAALHPSYHFAQSLAFKKDSPLRDLFNKYQNEMKKDGTLKAIHVKWFGKAPARQLHRQHHRSLLPNEKPTK